MNTSINKKLTSRYTEIMNELSINITDGKLGKISNPRYKNCNLRFSGFPYIGNKYSEAKRKILFVGLDIGADERCEHNTYHSLNSRKLCIAGNLSGCTDIAYNDHLSGTYAMALYILQESYSWSKQWDIFKSNNKNTFKSIINEHNQILPIDVLDYIAFTNIHKFVDIGRGCNLSPENKCWKEECNNNKMNINRSGADNRKWYNQKEEIQLLLDEIEILKPDIIYFQGQKSANKIEDQLMQINITSEIWVTDHPSSWTVGANKPDYVNSSRIRIMPKIGL